jgi:hypothetical protein
VGEDLQVSQIADLHGRVIVGKFMGRRMVYNIVLAWMEQEWKPSLGYLSIFHLLYRGWMGVVFQTKANVGIYPHWSMVLGLPPFLL